MQQTIVLLGIPASPFARGVAAHLLAQDLPVHSLSLDAPLEGKAVTVGPGCVRWEGLDLLSAGVIFVERLVFPWPQPELPPENRRGHPEHKKWIAFHREATSLIISAVASAAEVRPVVNSPRACNLAVSPSIALDRLARLGIRTHAWSLEPAPSGGPSNGQIVLDPSGRDRWHSPARPGAGEPALVLESFAGEVATLVVVGGKSVGGLKYADGESWARNVSAGAEATVAFDRDALGANSPQLITGPQPLREAADLASRAVAALHLDFAAVSVRSGGASPAILLCETAPDLAAWDRILDGCVAAAMADHLVHLASK